MHTARCRHKEILLGSRGGVGEGRARAVGQVGRGLDTMFVVELEHWALGVEKLEVVNMSRECCCDDSTARVLVYAFVGGVNLAKWVDFRKNEQVQKTFMRSVQAPCDFPFQMFPHIMASYGLMLSEEFTYLDHIL